MIIDVSIPLRGALLHSVYHLTGLSIDQPLNHSNEYNYFDTKVDSRASLH